METWIPGRNFLTIYISADFVFFLFLSKDPALKIHLVTLLASAGLEVGTAVGGVPEARAIPASVLKR